MKKWKVFLIHHTHIDIGYTHMQQEVPDLQFRNYEQTGRFISMVQSGHIGLDGLFADMHTALCRPEELTLQGHSEEIFLTNRLDRPVVRRKEGMF